MTQFMYNNNESLQKGFKNIETYELIAKILLIIKEKLGSIFSNQDKYLIAVQGSSSSGKSTIATNIYNLLHNNGIPCFLLKTDNYYKNYENQYFNTDEIEKRVNEYDFDNPGALDWKKINDVLRAIENNDEFLPLYEYSFVTEVCSGPKMTPNNFPVVTIIEGIYGFNCINDIIFNVEKYDPYTSSIITECPFIVNPYKPNFKVLKIRTTLCKNKTMDIRVARDILLRGKSKEQALLQLEKQVWPATCRWVNNKVFKEDIRIVHGSFNERNVIILIAAFSEYFLNKRIFLNDINYGENLIKYFKNECSNDCEFDYDVDLKLKHE